MPGVVRGEAVIARGPKAGVQGALLTIDGKPGEAESVVAFSPRCLGFIGGRREADRLPSDIAGRLHHVRLRVTRG